MMSELCGTSIPELDSEVPPGNTDKLPTLPNLEGTIETASTIVQDLRAFYHGKVGADPVESSLNSSVPALLAKYITTDTSQQDYPLVLYPATLNQQKHLFQSFAEFFAEHMHGASHRNINDSPLTIHIQRFKWHIHNLISGEAAIHDLSVTLRRAADGLYAELDKESQVHLREDMDRISIHLFNAGLTGLKILDYHRHTAIHLFLYTLRNQRQAKHAQFQQQVNTICSQLNALIPDAQPPNIVNQSGKTNDIATTGLPADPSKLTPATPPNCNTDTAPTRVQRISEIVALLTAFSQQSAPLLATIITDQNLEAPLSDPQIMWRESTAPCTDAIAIFDSIVADFAKLFQAVRNGQLEIAGHGSDAIAHPINLDFTDFTATELDLLPTLLVVTSGDSVVNNSITSFNRLYSSGKPIHLLCDVQPGFNPGTDDNAATTMVAKLARCRTELAYLGISYRQVAVVQSSLARPQHLLDGFLAATSRPGPALYVINTFSAPITTQSQLPSWVVATAAIESRAHPLCLVTPKAARNWIVRDNFYANTQAEKIWPIYTFSYRQTDDSIKTLNLAFTFADFAVLLPQLQGHFRVVPAGLDIPELQPIDAYLAVDAATASQFIPYVWLVQANHVLAKAVVSRELVWACRDRADYWRTLQDLAGIPSATVQQGINELRGQLKDQSTHEFKIREAKYAESLAEVRKDAVSEVMQRLASGLLQLDIMNQLPGAGGTFAALPDRATRPHDTSIPAQNATEPQAPTPATEQEATASSEAADEQEEAFAEEAWVDSPECTECEECSDINPTLFVYNDAKQALIGDINSGTYAQLVEAAEKCPAKCIHPGHPLNADEPDLEALIKRAEPFL